MTPFDATLIKALRSPPDDTSRARKAWWRLCWWWDDEVWSRYAPDWMRHGYWSLKRGWHSQVECRLRPRQAWLTKAAGRTWHDKPELIVTMLYAAIIHYCDPSGEDAFNTVVIEEPLATQLREVWAWAATGRAAVQAQMDGAYPELPRTPKGLIDWDVFPTAQLNYDEVNRLEALIQETDTKHLTWIVQSRATLWT